MKAFSNQRGLTLLGFIFILVLVLFFTYIGIKLVPIYLNHFSVVSEVKAIASEAGSANQPSNTLRRKLMTRLQVSYVDHVKPEHIRVVEGDGKSLVVRYEVEEHLIGNIDVIIRFDRAEPLRN